MSNSTLFSAMLVVSVLTTASLVARADAYDNGMDAYQASDYPEALHQWTTLAEHGHAQAAYNLGFMYEFGYGVVSSDAAAFNYYLRAAQLGHPQAQHTVAWMYGRGKGVTADRIQAARWTDIAENSGNTAHTNEIDKQEFVDNLVSELKKAGARYDAQKATQQNPPAELEASNQTS